MVFNYVYFMVRYLCIVVFNCALLLAVALACRFSSRNSFREKTTIFFFFFFFFYMNGNTERAQCALSQVCIPQEM